MCVGEGKGDRDREFIRGRSVPIVSQTRFDSINILHIWMVRASGNRKITNHFNLRWPFHSVI